MASGAGVYPEDYPKPGYCPCIENKIVGLLTVSVDERPAAAADIVTRVETGRIGRDRSGREQRQLHIVACRQRQRFICRSINDGAHFGRVRLEDRRLAGYLDRLRYLSTFICTSIRAVDSRPA